MSQYCFGVSDNLNLVSELKSVSFGDRSFHVDSTW